MGEFRTIGDKSETADLEKVQAVADYLRRAANRPELRFEEPHR